MLNDKLYSPPHAHVEGNKATKYRVQWSDLFFDVLFVGVVFRLGDLLLAGMGVGYSETSVHFRTVLNTTSFAPALEPYREDAVIIFTTVFLAVWGMWQNRLAYGSKVGTGDVLHKVVDVLQGLIVLLTAVHITTPEKMQRKETGQAYCVAGGLVCFQLVMMLLWVELFYSPDSHANFAARETAKRNLMRDFLSVLPLLASFGTITYDVSLVITTSLWATSWFIPFFMRVLQLKFVNDHNAVRDLHRYVIHRLGDGALIVLGEGVLQIIRAETLEKNWYFYLSVTLGLFVVTAVRIAVWSMDCFHDSAKHAQLLSLKAGLAAFFVRSLAGPALVAFGVALKKIVSMGYSGLYYSYYVRFYWLVCGASFAVAFTQVLTYDLHRFAFHHRFRHAELVFMLIITGGFIAIPFAPFPAWAIEALVLANWLTIVWFHFLLDDYFLLKEEHKEDPAEQLLLPNASFKNLLKGTTNFTRALSRGRNLVSNKNTPPVRRTTTDLNALPREKLVVYQDFTPNPLFTVHFAKPADLDKQDSVIVLPAPAGKKGKVEAEEIA